MHKVCVKVEVKEKNIATGIIVNSLSRIYLYYIFQFWMTINIFILFMLDY